ncbi:MAG: DHH family phosphoesterase [Nanoarchaeota archaeon]|nr:DHH family phosphoesterase [Nanoarchaeota archaeon]
MNIINPRLIERFVDFIKALSPEDNIAIYHDTDPDGICAATLMFNALEKLGLKTAILEGFDHGDPDMVEDVLMKVKESDINVIVFLDLLADRHPDKIKEVEKHANIILIDHHPIENDVASEKTIFIKPQIFVEGIIPSRYCTTKLVYDLMSRLVDLSDLDWLCGIGIIADFAFDAWEDYLDGLYQKYNVDKKKMHIDSKFGAIAKLIVAANTISFEEAEKAALKVIESRTMDEAIENLKGYNKIEDEIQKFLDNSKECTEEFPDKNMAIIHIKSQYYINSIIATRISLNLPEKIFFVVQADKSDPERLAVSGRCQSKRVHLGKIMHDAVKGFEEASGGGHAPAAGANFKKEDYKEFKKRILEMVGKEEYKNG